MLLSESLRSNKIAFYHDKSLGNKHKDANLEVAISLK